MKSLCLSIWVCLVMLSSGAGPRDAEWKKVAEALKKDQPKTQIKLLTGIEKAALAEKKWAEASRAMAQRIAIEGKIEGPVLVIKKLDAELEKAPEQVKPVLRALAAGWMHRYYQQNQWQFMHRSSIGIPSGDDLETWDLARILQEIDQRMQLALADEASLKMIPVAEIAELLTKGNLGDEWRPTMFDFVAHKALNFYSAEEVAVSRPTDAFVIAADSPVLGSLEQFLAWEPETEDKKSPKLRALQILQSLLSFHQSDEVRDAFLLADLERLRWARTAALAEGKDARVEKALRKFIEQNVAHPISAWARVDLGEILVSQKKTKEAHAIYLPGAKAFPKHAFGKLCQNEVTRLEEKQLFVSTETQWTPAGEEIHIQHRNIKKVWFRLYSMPFKLDKEMIYRDPLPDRKKWIPEMLKTKPLRAWSSDSVDQGDYAVRRFSLEPPKNLPDGYHVLIASSDEEFSVDDNSVSMVGVHITPLALAINAQKSGGVEGHVLNAVTGAPLAGIEVKTWILTPDEILIEDTKTDDSGYFRFQTKKNGQFLVIAHRGEQRAVTRLWSSKRRIHREPDHSMTVFFTDRAIYRPGQTVHFKGISYIRNQSKEKYELRKKRKGTVTIHDPNQKEVSRLKIITNERGSFSGSFTAPSSGLLGRFQISLARANGGTSIRVEEYKRPKFFTKIDLPQEAAALGEEVTFKVRSEAYTGAPIDGAKVTWRVTRTPRFPAWTRWCWWAAPINSASEEIAHGVSETESDGSVAITFMAKPDQSVDEALEPIFEFSVTADVTGGAGETRSATRQISVGYTSLKASLTSADWLVAGKDLEFKVRTESLDGEGQETKGVLKIHRLKEPEVCPRPSNAGQNHGPAIEQDEKVSTDPNRWEPGELVREFEVQTDDEGKSVVKSNLEAGAYRLIFETQDANGRKIQALLGIEVVAPNAKDFPTQMPFYTSSPAWSVEPGESVSIFWGSGHEEARACVEWYQNKRLLKREWSKEGQTQQLFTYPIEEKNRGGITVAIRQVTMNRMHQFQRVIQVPWKNKELKIRWEHLVSKLEPGAKETWTAIVEGADGEAAIAEMVATMYDASLDAYAPHQFYTLMGVLRYEWGNPPSVQFSSVMKRLHSRVSFKRAQYFGSPPKFREYRKELQLFHGLSDFRRDVWGSSGSFGGEFLARGLAKSGDRSRYAMEAPMNAMTNISANLAEKGKSIDGDLGIPPRAEESIAPDVSQVAARKNLQETAFFFPTLTSDADGKIRISFTMPEALTKWRFLGMAHDVDFRSGLLEGETVTAKDLMIQPNPPRFVREGDVLEFTVKVTNQSEVEQSGIARFTLADAATDKGRTAEMGIASPDQKFTVPAKESRTLKWKIAVPNGAGFLKYKAVAATDDLTDGEEGWLPVLSRRILVTESMSLPIRNAGKKEFEFTKLLESGASETLEDRFLHVQVVSQPAWYAVMALPYLMEYPHEGSEQTFNRYYANALARHIAGSDPKMRRIFDQWKAGGDTLDSPLMKNSDLKGILLDETPWLREATTDAAARRRVGLLFDENHMNNELEKALRKLSKMQNPDGLWPWFPGGRGSEYMSRYVTTGFARLRSLGAETDITPALRALVPLDAAMTRRYERLRKDKKLDHMNLSPWVAHHLYTRSFFLKDKKLSQRDKVAFDYFVEQAKKHWVELTSRMSRAHVGLALHRLGDKEVPKLVTRSLKENAKVTEEQGMFWKDREGEGWWWWQAPIETQAMMIEAFRDIDQDAKAVDNCQVWLIKQKQVSDWKTTKATADAVYSLLMGGRNLLDSNALLKISLGGKEVKPEDVEAGTGFYESRFVEQAVTPQLGKIELNKSDQGVSWASVHWQYLEDMGKVTNAEGQQLKLEKKLFVRKNTDKGPVLMPLEGSVDVGDELVTRVILRNDRAMEFVHLKDLRGSGTEPTNVLSGYRWQGGFGYYEVTRDTASHFFIDRLPPGVHVFETSVRVQHAGEYQTGIAEVRCMYAPEFASHSNSVKIKAE